MGGLPVCVEPILCVGRTIAQFEQHTFFLYNRSSSSPDSFSEIDEILVLIIGIKTGIIAGQHSKEHIQKREESVILEQKEFVKELLHKMNEILRMWDAKLNSSPSGHDIKHVEENLTSLIESQGNQQCSDIAIPMHDEGVQKCDIVVVSLQIRIIRSSGTGKKNSKEKLFVNQAPKLELKISLSQWSIFKRGSKNRYI
ncbi:Uncharacterized protein Fot_29600 [Forsythia ovata]|uniref:Uncharacterized protein n=1 Tax=Forsythia ovata TaxID=205694 RepID=A0ABD1TSD8_9LAMI